MYTEYLRALKKVPHKALGLSGWRSRTASCRRCCLSSEVQSSGVMFLKENRNGKRDERDRDPGSTQDALGLVLKSSQMSLTEMFL